MGDCSNSNGARRYLCEDNNIVFRWGDAGKEYNSVSSELVSKISEMIGHENALLIYFYHIIDICNMRQPEIKI